MGTYAYPPDTSSARLTVPGPRALPLIGSLGSALKAYKDPLGYISQLFRRYGPVVALCADGGTNLYSPLPHCPGTVFAYGPELARQASTQHEVFYKYPFTATLYRKRQDAGRYEPLKHFGVGLFGVNSDEHRQQRRLLMPAFHKKRIEAYRDDMVAITRAELDQWQIGHQLGLAEALRFLTMRVATKTLFGRDIGEQGGEAGWLLQETLVVGDSPLTTLLPFDLPGLPFRRYLDLMGRFSEQMRAIIAQKRASGLDEGDVLSMLLHARDEESGVQLTEDEMLGHTGLLFGGGQVSTTNALSWTLLLLTQHPQVTADLLDELDGVLHGEPPTVEQLQHLPLLDRVVKESMRVLPPALWNARILSQPTEFGGYALPAGTEVFVSIYHTHRMPELYPQPEVFDPGRWEHISPSIFAYQPFSAGPRMCIGASFAIMEIKIILAMLVQRYRLQCLPRPRVDRSGHIHLAPKGGLPMIVHQQDRQFTRGVGGIRGTIREMVTLPN